MEVKIDKSFEKDIKKIKDKYLLRQIVKTVRQVQLSNNLHQIKNLQKLKGNKSDFRIKIGEYRLGVILSGSTVEFIRCLHRKDIYKHFPK